MRNNLKMILKKKNSRKVFCKKKNHETPLKLFLSWLGFSWSSEGNKNNKQALLHFRSYLSHAKHTGDAPFTSCKQSFLNVKAWNGQRIMRSYSSIEDSLLSIFIMKILYYTHPSSTFSISLSLSSPSLARKLTNLRSITGTKLKLLFSFRVFTLKESK